MFLPKKYPLDCEGEYDVIIDDILSINLVWYKPSLSYSSTSKLVDIYIQNIQTGALKD